ncbi:MAG: hypothetical protein II008_07145 [Oscillospiraceae bacterium]|nr:hypothetical protein [Oscillospiraceae bacterium]
MNEQISREFVNERISKATLAIKRVETNRMDELTKRIRLRSDEDYLLYSIANSLLCLVELTIRKMEERQ